MSLDRSARPRVRTAGLVMTQLGDDLMLYDEQSHTLHTLNAVSTSIWHLADGSRSLNDLELATGQDRATIELALAHFEEAGLLEAGAPAAKPRNRRRLLRDASLLAVPAIISVTAPAAATHSSGNTCGKPCQRDKDCRGTSTKGGGWGGCTSCKGDKYSKHSAKTCQ